MATTVTDDILRDLAGFHAATGCALSIYVDLDPSGVPTIPDVKTKVSSLLAEAEKQAEATAGGRDCRLALRDDLARIREWFGDEFERDGAKGIAIFASSGDRLFHTVPLSEGAGDAVSIGEELYLAPLARRLGRGDGVLVVAVSRERGSVYRLDGGRLVEVADESEEQPGQHDQGGWSQGRYQRHIDHLVQQHLKTVGDQVDRRLRGARGLRIVVVGPEEMRGDFEAALSSEAREAIAGWTTAEAHAGPTELLAAVRPIVDEAHARDELDAFERWEEEYGRGGRAAGGWRQTLEAASDGRVGVLLLAEREPRPAWRCPECGRAAAEPGACALDGAQLEERADGADLAIHLTLAHGGTLVGLGAGALDDVDGIAALLRF